MKVKTAYIFFIIFIGLLISYLPVLEGHYVFSDSAKFWSRMPGTIDHYFGHVRDIRIGRFLGAYILSGYGLFINSVRGLNVIRFISVLQLSLCAFLCFLIMRKGFASAAHAVLIAVMLFTLPPFQVMVSWTPCTFHTTAILAACLSALSALKAPEALPFKNRMVHKYALLSFFLLFCANYIYPPAAMFYWVTALLIFLSYRTVSSEDAKRRLAVHYAVGLSAAVVYALTLRIFLRHVDVAELYKPTAVTTHYGDKLAWFVMEPLYNSLNLWEIFPGPGLAAAVIVFAGLAGLLFLFQARRRGEKKVVFEALFYVALFSSLILLSSLPTLAAAGNAPFYRCYPALTALIVIILVCALYRWATVLPERAGKTVVTVILMASCFYGIYKASGTLLRYRVIPSQAELVYLKKAMNQAIAGKYKKVHINLPQWRFVRHRYDEFGGVTSNWSEAMYPMITCVVRELAQDAGLDLQGFTIYLDEGKVIYAFRRKDEQKPFFRYSFYVTVSHYHEKKFRVDRKTLNIDLTDLYNFM